LIEDTAGLVATTTQFNQSHPPYQDVTNCIAYTDDQGSAVSQIGSGDARGSLARISSLVGPTDGLPYSWIGFTHFYCSTAHPLFCCR
jgi:hypothetical protein